MMATLKINSKRIGYKLVGVTVRTKIHSYLSLYTIAKGITKASVFKEIIMDWVEKQKQTESDIKLVNQIIHKVQLQWQIERQKRSDANIVVFKTELRQELEDKGLEADHINLILRDIK
jgi:hypothetical protein